MNQALKVLCDPNPPMSPPGLEPGAYCLGGSRSIHLSYGDQISQSVCTR